ncbi:MAG: hypothetical protein FWD61_19200 [Phycisphaerales bacterium]|nr:hypothetical protein [Phycisphaerales bacterium]
MLRHPAIAASRAATRVVPVAPRPKKAGFAGGAAAVRHCHRRQHQKLDAVVTKP